MMKKFVTLFVISLLSTNVIAQTAQDSAAVIDVAAYGYVGAFFIGDYIRLQNSLHPNLEKCIVNSPTSVRKATRDGLVNHARTRTPKSYADINLKYELLDITDNVGSVLVTNTSFWDLVFVTKYDTTWLVTNVVWDHWDIPQVDLDDEIIQTATDFIHCLCTGNDTSLAKMLHPAAAMRRPISTTEIDHVNRDWLIEQTQNNRWGYVDENSLEIDVEIMKSIHSYASVKVTSNWGTEFIHMRYFEPQWYIINGIWNRSSEINVDVDDREEMRPGHIQLGKNYPNPFNPSTIIEYSLDKPAYVNLEIYNMMGQKVRTLVNEFMTPGQYQTSWNARNDNELVCSSGIYFYRISSPEFTEQKSMSLVR